MRRLTVLLILWAAPLLAQQPFHTSFHSSGKMTRHDLTVSGPLEVHLTGLPANADWALAVKTSPPPSHIAVAEVQYAPACCGGITPISSLTDWRGGHTTGNGTVMVNGLASLAKGHTLMIYLEVPQGTALSVKGDGGMLFTTNAADAIVRNGAVTANRVDGPQTVLQHLQGQQNVPAIPDMMVSPKGDGKYIASPKNVLAHVQNPATVTGATVDGNVRVMLEIDPTGHVTHVQTAQSGPAPLEALVAQAARQWTFNPFMEGGTARTVIGSVLIVFRNGVGVWQ